MDSLIRWKKGDYIKLGQAVSRFNKLINELDVDEREYLPDLKDYKDIREHIKSRKELNRVIKALRSANIENLLETRALESGEELSKWEYREVRKARNRAFKTLEMERQKILSERPSIGMGDERLSEIHAIEQSFIDLENKTGRDLKRVMQRIFHVGRKDYRIAKDEQYRQNFYKALEGLSSYKNYDKLKKELDKIKNPTKFYEYVKQSPILMDIFLWYKDKDSVFYGSFGTNEEAFDSSLIFHLGITDVNA